MKNDTGGMVRNELFTTLVPVRHLDRHSVNCVVIMNVALVYFELPIGAAKDSVYTPMTNCTEFKGYYEEYPKCLG